METIKLDISITHLKQSLRRLSKEEKKELYFFLEEELGNDKVEDPIFKYLISEKSLSKDWLLEEEDEQWKDL
ncbi:hypothetical protein SYJ56_17810 [Algoriphagus sp. D3-2-R+10]|uniref:hypothetical protein n=1 Tax=Algoriphagus aurantiacus TaxID=3103948 RepID=UPI002B3916C6|nr:hypothetical protein [Algoriphagus sp. D3-2-R+10]MEB2777176.1 hypothetical protein [Algoriphagus sp. D3-2-R+10]